MAATRADDITCSSAEDLRGKLVSRYALRLHVALILAACFAAGLGVTKLLLMAGMSTMWMRYSLALVAAYAVFLAGVRIWLRYAGLDRGLAPRRGANWLDGNELSGIDIPAGGGGGRVDLPFRGGGGGSGGAGASLRFSGATLASGDTSSASGLAASSSHGGGSGGGLGIDFGDDGWVILALVAVVAALFGAVVYLIYAAPAILADAGFAAMLSAGLVRSTRRIASAGWVSSVVGHTWIAFASVLALAVVFALVAQHHFPDARTLIDVIRRL